MVKNVNNRFRLFDNKTSLSKRFSRMLTGGTTETKGNKLGWWERDVIEEDVFTDRVFELRAEHEGRPDLVAFEVYNNTRLTWLVLQYNSIVDIEEEFVPGRKINLPAPSRVFSQIAVKNPEKEQVIDE